MFRGGTNRYLAVVIWAALAPMWLAGDTESLPPSVRACLELEIALQHGVRQDLSEVVAQTCDAIEAERNPILRRMMLSRLWAYRERLPVGLTFRVDVLLEGTVPMLSASETGPPELLAIQRTQFHCVPVAQSTGIRGTQVVVTARDGDSTPDALEITTTFVSATRVINAAERWSSRSVSWGRVERLAAIIHADTTDIGPAYFDQEECTVYLGMLDPPPGALEHDPLDVARVADAVAHEAGHAIVYALKPGWGTGVSSAIHEGIADMLAVFVALENPWVLERVLRETDGDLRRDNEATRLCECIGSLIRGTGATAVGNPDSLRSVVTGPDLHSSGLDPDDVELPLDVRASWKATDPHGPSQIISSALYGTFCRVYDQLRSGGTDPIHAVLEARAQTGAVMLRALDYCGEHRVSLRDYSRALLWADHVHLQGKLRDALISSLAERGIIDPTRDVILESPPLGGAPAGVSLDPDVRQHEEILPWAEHLERRLLSTVRERNDFSGRFIRHRHRYSLMEEAPVAAMSVYSDSTTTDGYRVVRLHYRVPGIRLIYASRANEGGADTPVFADESHFPPVDVYVSLLFDSSGNLIVMHTDRPWP